MHNAILTQVRGLLPNYR